MIFLGADHAGFETKELIKELLHQIEVPFEDLGAEALIPGDDYPDYAQRVAIRVSRGFGTGILVCDTGIGMDIAANKVKGVRAALCTSVFMAQRSREHNNSNVLVLGKELNTPAEINEIVRMWLDTPFSREERHIQRLKKIDMIEKVLKDDPGGR
jgi:ribose 5-phosphate isomerase B